VHNLVYGSYLLLRFLLEHTRIHLYIYVCNQDTRCQKYSGEKDKRSATKLYRNLYHSFFARFSWTLSKRAANYLFYLFGDEGPGSFGPLDVQAAIFYLFTAGNDEARECSVVVTRQHVAASCLFVSSPFPISTLHGCSHFTRIILYTHDR
jgi:hypothetical protein